MTSGWNATRKVMAGLLVAGAAAMVVPVPAAARGLSRRRRRLLCAGGRYYDAAAAADGRRAFDHAVDGRACPPRLVGDAACAVDCAQRRKRQRAEAARSPVAGSVGCGSGATGNPGAERAELVLCAELSQ